MGEQIKVADVETIERFRASLLVASETFGLALEEAEGEIERTLAWVESEQPDFWRKRMRKVQDEVVMCKSALFRKQEIKATADARPSVVDEKKALDRAMKRLEYAETKLRNTKRWSTELPRQSVIFKGALSGMHTVLDRDVPRMSAMLKRMTEHLEAYLRGGEESDRLLEILGASSNMSRGGDVDETGAADESAAADSATDGSVHADSTKDDITTTDSTTGTSASFESGEQTPPEVTQ
ncbi:MAG: hypothetical protein DWH75_01685 [Planctomycetota bacterium]|nr:MAG: hypothetical protein DWH75_01685 [Planctomycetota bacterium]